MDPHPVTFKLELTDDYYCDEEGAQEIFQDLKKGVIDLDNLVLESVINMDTSSSGTVSL